MVKKKFIDPATAAHFHLVHRSQRDPKAADPEAPQRVLAALPETGNQARKSVRGTQSTRAILQEQDLEGFDEAVDDPLEAAAIHALDGINEWLERSSQLADQTGISASMSQPSSMSASATCKAF